MKAINCYWDEGSHSWSVRTRLNNVIGTIERWADGWQFMTVPASPYASRLIVGVVEEEEEALAIVEDIREFLDELRSHPEELYDAAGGASLLQRMFELSDELRAAGIAASVNIQVRKNQE